MSFWPPIDESAIAVIITDTGGLIPTRNLEQYKRERDAGLLRLCSGCKRYRLVDSDPSGGGAKLWDRLNAKQPLCVCFENWIENRILQGDLPIE